MIPLWVLGHSLSRVTLVSAGLWLRFILSGSGQKGSLAVLLRRALLHLALSILHPSLAPRASRPQELIAEPSLPLRQICPWCLGAQILRHCRARLTSHSLDAGHLLLSTMLV